MASVDRTDDIDAHAALDAVVHGVAIATRSNADVGLSYVNPAFAQLTGYDRAEIRDRGLQLLSGSGAEPAVLQRLRNAILAAEDFCAEWQIQRRDGNTTWARVSARAAGNDSKQVVITLEDIADHKRARESLRA